MTVLHLGVLDIPHVAPTGKAQTAPLTTGDVADILEAKYHVMELFYEERGPAIADAMAESMGDALADLLGGAPPGNNATTAAMGKIQDLFVQFIDRKQLDGVVPGVPTLAALKGVNHRFLHPFAKANPPRPSFKDTGLYEDSFRAWVD